MPQTFGPYRIVRSLGEGGQGRVYLAHDPITDAAVALKIVPLPAEPAAANAVRGRFLAEAYAAAKLVHRHIAHVVAAGEQDGQGWLAMDYAPGVSLRRYVHAGRLLPEPLVLHAGRCVALALAHAHAMGVVHRDVKPSNVIVHWPLKLVKLTDFGVARSADAQATGTGVVLGTPAYLAPEQLAGAAPQPRTDLYALGVTLFELLSGQLPFAAASMGELLRDVAQVPAPDVRSLAPQVSAGLAAVVAELLRKAAADRPASADRVAQRLAELTPPP